MRTWLIIWIFLLGLACRKPFDAPPSDEVGTTLVVEGGIAVGDSAANRIVLSRLRPLQDTVISRPEPGATVSIVSNAGRTWTLAETGEGQYTATVTIPPANDHKLRIVTKSGRRYETPFLRTVNTPAIDSVTWSEDPDVSIFVHTHDPANATPYYRWDYTETWEYRSWYDSDIEYVNGQLFYRGPSNQVYSCWRNKESDRVILANTLALSENRISYQPLTKVIKPDERISQRYSILVRQVGLTREAYDFWNILKKNTELTGSLFDPQPSQLPGNITCLDDPKEKVIGFISSGKQTFKRIFIRNADLGSTWPKEDEELYCKEIKGSIDEMKVALNQDTTLGPAYYITGGGLAVAKKLCVDCTRKGGSNKKPSFW